MSDIKFQATSDFSKVQADYDKTAEKAKKLEDANRALTSAANAAGKAQQDASAGASQKQDKLKRDYEEIVRHLAKVEAENRKLQRSTKEAGDGMGRMAQFAGGLKSDLTSFATGMVASVFSINALVDGFKQARAEAKALREEQARQQIDVGTAQQKMIPMLGRVPLANAQQFTKDVGQIAAETNLPQPAQAYLAAGDILSATAGNQSLTKAILRTTIPLSRETPEDIPILGGGIADVATIVGAETDDQVKSLTGLVIAAVGQARITKLSQFGEIAKGVAAASNVDPRLSTRSAAERMKTVQESAAGVAAVTGAIKDEDAAMSATAFAQMAAYLEQLLPEQDRTKILSPEQRTIKQGELAALTKQRDKQRGKGDTAQAMATTAKMAAVERELSGVQQQGTGMRTLAERIAAVQGSPELQAKFWGGDSDAGLAPASFRAKIEPTMKAWLADPNSEVSKRFTTAVQELKPDPAAYDELIRNRRFASPQTQMLEQQMARKSLVAGYDVGAVEAGRRVEAGTASGDVLLRTRRGIAGLHPDWYDESIGSNVGVGLQSLGMSPEMTAESQLLKRRMDLLGLSGSFGGARGLIRGLMGKDPVKEAEAEASEETRGKIKLIDAQLSLLRGSRVAEVAAPDGSVMQAAKPAAAVAAPPRRVPVAAVDEYAPLPIDLGSGKPAAGDQAGVSIGSALTRLTTAFEKLSNRLGAAGARSDLRTDPSGVA